MHKFKLLFLIAVVCLTLCATEALAQFSANDIQTFNLSGGGGVGNENCSSSHNGVTPPGWEWQWNVSPLCLWIDAGLTTSPSLDNKARKYEMSWTQSGSGSLYHAKLNTTPDTTDTNWTWSVWVYYPTSLSVVDQLEFDFNQVLADGDTVIMAAQCSFTSGGGHWEIFNGWPVTTTLACPRSQWANSAGSYGGWHNVTIQAHWVPGTCGTVGSCTLVYDSIAFDGTSTPCSSFTSSCSGNGADTLGWTVGDLVQNVQVNENTSSGTFQFYTDEMSTYAGSSSTVAEPTFSLSGTSLSISDTTSGATICYTINNTTPTTNGAGTCTGATLTYSSALTVTPGEIIKAVGSKTALSDSPIASYTVAGPIHQYPALDSANPFTGQNSFAGFPLELGGLATDPSPCFSGIFYDFWYNSTTNLYMGCPGGVATVFGSGSFSASGDLSGSSSSQEVVGLHTVPFCTGFTPSNGQALEYTTASSPNPCYTAVTTGGSFNAGGDLTGSPTSQQVVGLDAVPFCAGFTPTNGQALEYITSGSPNPCYTAAAPSGTFPSGLTGQVAGYKANGSSGFPLYLPDVDVRAFFPNPFPTIAQAQNTDFGAVLGAALTFAGGSACVNLNGLAQTMGQGGKLGMTTNPLVNQTGGSAPCIKGGNGLVIIFGAMIETPNGPMEIDGFPSAASANPRGLIFAPCNNTGGCTIGSGITVPQYTSSATCVSSGGLNCLPTGSPTSANLVTYSAGTITIGNSSTGCSGTLLCVTGSSTLFTSGSPNNVLPGAILIASCGGACTPGSVSNWVTGRIVSVNSATSLTLEAGWTGTTSSMNYIIYNPNTAIAICDGCNGASYGVNTFGHVWRNVFIDMAGVGGSIGYFSHSCQEGCEYDNLRISMQENSYGAPTGALAVGACAMWDATLRGAAGISPNSPIGVGQFSAVNISNCSNANNVAGIHTNGFEFEGYSLMDGKTLGGPNSFMLSTIVGDPSDYLNDCVWIDGLMHGTFYGHHCESVSNDDIEVGQNNPVYGIHILDAFSANNNPNAVVEFHVGSLGNVVESTSRLKTNGCLVMDDNLATPCTGTASGGTPLSLVEPQYLQAGNAGNSLVAGGTLVAPSIGTNLLYSAAGTPLPTCNAAIQGQRAVVKDATSPTYMGTYTSGGAITAEVICSYNGSIRAWLTH